MNTAEDIKRMLGELVDEAIRIGRAEGEKTLGTEAQLKEQVKRLVDEKQMLVQKMNVLAGENDFLEDENEALRAKVDSYDGVSREQATEVVRLKEQVKRLDEENERLFAENNDLREQLDKLAAGNDELEEPRREPLPCPFCGGVPEVHGIKVNEFFVACPDENCPVNPETNVYPTATEAVDAWNGWRQGQKTCDWR